MRNVFITAMAIALVGTAGFANPITGEVELGFAETANDKIGATMGVDLDINAGDMATVALGFSAADGDNLTLDNWTVGTDIEGISVTFGDDTDLMPGAEGEHTLAAPAMAEALGVSIGSASVAIGLTDYTSDIADVSNVQGAYDFGVATIAGNIDLDTDNVVIGAEIAPMSVGIASVGGAFTYDSDAELFGFESVTTLGELTAYLNGDDSDPLQNIGGSWKTTYAGTNVELGANYNIDTEDFAPTATVGFSF